MASEETCKHGKISRNCYTCHIDFSYPKEKSELDNIHETISELKIRLSKLEQYRRLQDDKNNGFQYFSELAHEHYLKLDEHRKKQVDENRAVSKYLASLDESYQGLSAELKHLLEQQEYVPFDEDDYDDEVVEPPVILGENVRFVGNITIPKETLCMDKFTKPKTTGLTFEEAGDDTVKMNVNIPKDLHKELKQLALDLDTTITSLVIRGLKEII